MTASRVTDGCRVHEADRPRVTGTVVRADDDSAIVQWDCGWRNRENITTLVVLTPRPPAAPDAVRS